MVDEENLGWWGFWPGWCEDSVDINQRQRNQAGVRRRNRKQWRSGSKTSHLNILSYAFSGTVLYGFVQQTIWTLHLLSRVWLEVDLEIIYIKVRVEATGWDESHQGERIVRRCLTTETLRNANLERQAKEGSEEVNSQEAIQKTRYPAGPTYYQNLILHKT